MRPIGEPLDRVPHAPTVHRTVRAPLLILIEQISVSRPAGRAQRLCLWNPPPFEKGGRKLSLALRGRLLKRQQTNMGRQLFTVFLQLIFILFINSCYPIVNYYVFSSFSGSKGVSLRPVPLSFSVCINGKSLYCSNRGTFLFLLAPAFCLLF